MDGTGNGGGALAAAGLSCGSCGTDLPVNSKFCNECGAPVSAAAISAEYKQVTVLFADVVRSMDIARAVGAERLREIMVDLTDRCAGVVQRYGGTVDKFTGDGIMAVFGAPVALEDHAVRACLAALGVQEEATRLAWGVAEHDNADLKLRVGLNSGQVIAGEIGPGALGYTAIGEQVGMAQRMESVAPPGGVMLSESTARLVEGAAALGERQLVQVKGAEVAVPACRLLGMVWDRTLRRAESHLVGRAWEMSAVEGLLNRATAGHGAVVGVVGPPGIGKSRLTREVSAMAASRGVDVLTTFCESHTSQVPFHAVAQFLRAAMGVEGLEAQAARGRLRDRISDADAEDILLLDDLLGVIDHDAVLPRIDPDARGRRLTALVNAASLARENPAVYVVEDAHWIDEVSESMLADCFTVIPQTSSLVLITYRPEYEGALARVQGAQTIALAPLSDPETAALVSELLGPDPSVGGLCQTIAEKAAGNPFFAEEIVRELAERGVLQGTRSAYVSTVDVAEASIPATVQATIAARIDRLNRTAKLTLNVAAVIGSRFTAELLGAVISEPVIDELLRAQLIDDAGSNPGFEYVFHHPLIRAVAYESQLRTDRAELHRRVAAAIQACEPRSTDENAAAIAEHLEIADDLLAAYAWHMRAGAWLTKRDFAAAHRSWKRAARVADSLPIKTPQRMALRIAAKTMVCTTTWLVGGSAADAGFDALRQLCVSAGDAVSMAVAMYGVLVPMTVQLRLKEASALASEQAGLFASSADPVSMTGVVSAAMFAMLHAGRSAEAEQLAQRVIDLVDGDPIKGTVPGLGSPLAMAHLYRGLAGSCFGRPAARHDIERAITMQREVDPNPAALVVPIAHAYAFQLLNGNISSEDTTLRDTEEALRLAEQCGNDVGLALARVAYGLALLRHDHGDRRKCLELLRAGRDAHLRQHNALGASVADIGLAQLQAEQGGERDAAIDTARRIVEQLFDCGESLGRGPAVTTLVEALLSRGSADDLQEAQVVVERLAATRIEPGFALYEVHLLRLRALVARAHGDNSAYRDYRDRYRHVATSLGFEGHEARAEAMSDGGQ